MERKKLVSREEPRAPQIGVEIPNLVITAHGACSLLVDWGDMLSAPMFVKLATGDTVTMKVPGTYYAP